MAELHEYREQFPILAETTYLINHSLGAMPAAAEERVPEYAHSWNTRGVRAWEEGWWDLPLTVGDQIGRLIGAPPGSVSMHQNVTIAEAVVISCFGFDGPRRRIVYEDGNFPSVRHLYQAQRGADILVAADDEGVIEAIDERTLLVPVTHVLYKTGEIQDVEAIVEAAHEHGALVVLDAYQSAGTVPLDVTALGVDFAVGGSVKWLCGGPGAAGCTCGPSWRRRSSPRSPAGRRTRAVRVRARAGLRRGRGALPDRHAERARAVRGDGRLRRGRGGRRRAHPRALAGADGAAGRAARRSGFPVGGPPDPRRGGTVVVQVPGSTRVNRELAARGVICDWRPDVGLRLGPHFFNTDDELRFAVQQIVELSGRAAPEGAAHRRAPSVRPRA